MIIQCGRCSTKFKIDDSRIKPEGSNVRCSKCGHIFVVKPEEQIIDRGQLTDEPENITIERNPIDNKIEGDLNVGTEGEDIEINQDRIDPPAEQTPESGEEAPDEERLDIEIDRSSKDAGNWEEFVSISKTGEHAGDIEADEGEENEKGQDDFNWEKINIEEETGEVGPGIPEMFEDEEGTGTEEQGESIGSQDKSESHGYEYKRGSSEKLTLDTDAPDKYMDSMGDYGRPEQSTIHQRSEIYGSQKKSKRSAIGKIANTLMIAAVFVIIITASLIILVNLELIPEENVTRVKTFVESVIPIKLTAEQARDTAITQHSGNWMNTRYGPLYVVSGMIQNISDRPIHYIKIKSEFISAGQTLYEDTIYAGNTFSENELKVSKIEDIVFKLKKKNGDIDYYDMKKLSGLNYDVKPGESIPFFAVFPYDSTVLGLKYNLQVVNYEDSSIN